MILLILVCLLIELLQPDRHLFDRTNLLLIFNERLNFVRGRHILVARTATAVRGDRHLAKD
ncbi:hypothetical protein QUB63_25905 [Microcoleus sp. ARI1-B5]|uniref:hypothetical protein n=1 Tax=unclassified Microcoleus TaxID=2642155 RepID=UPI002FD2A0C8